MWGPSQRSSPRRSRRPSAKPLKPRRRRQLRRVSRFREGASSSGAPRCPSCSLPLPHPGSIGLRGAGRLRARGPSSASPAPGKGRPPSAGPSDTPHRAMIAIGSRLGLVSARGCPGLLARVALVPAGRWAPTRAVESPLAVPERATSASHMFPSPGGPFALWSRPSTRLCAARRLPGPPAPPGSRDLPRSARAHSGFFARGHGDTGGAWRLAGGEGAVFPVSHRAGASSARSSQQDRSVGRTWWRSGGQGALA